MRFFHYVFQDLSRYEAQGRGKALSLSLFSPGFRTVVLYRLARYFASRKVCFLPGLLLNVCQTLTGAEISYNAGIGRGFKIAHPNGIVIGAYVVAGDDLTVFQGVTIGAKIIMENNIIKTPEKRYPAIGNGVTLYSGAKIIGAIELGNNVTVGANAVVLESVPDGATVVGVPARVVSII